MPAFGIGACITIAIVLASIREGVVFSIGGLVAVVAFLTIAVAWVVVPHWVVAFTIPLFAFIPAGKVLVTPWIGPLKDLVTIAALAAVVAGLYRHRRVATALERPLLLLGVAFLGLYVVNIGGALSGSQHGLAWAQGLRLVAEPLILLAAGLTVLQPARTLRFAAVSMIGTGCVVAFYGLVQQGLGGSGLVRLGYSYTSQVRTIGSHLRSFGTLDDPFLYAAFLLLALAMVIFWMQPGWLANVCGGLIVLGLAASFVRTALVVVVALLAIALVRNGRPTIGFVLLGVSAAAGLAILFGGSGASQTTSVRAGPQEYITLNGRTTVWKTIFSNPAKLPFGLGVGQVGTAAQRAQQGVTVTLANPTKQTTAVDSGYFAAVADVGLIGLALLLALFVRLLAMGVQRTRGPDDSGWLVLGLLAVLLIDAVSRASFTGFPTAFLSMLLVGLAVAASSGGEIQPAGASR